MSELVAFTESILMAKGMRLKEPHKKISSQT